MRNITTATVRHNERSRAGRAHPRSSRVRRNAGTTLLVCGAVLIALTGGGCGGGGDAGSGEAASGDVHVVPECAVTITLAPYEAFLDLAEATVAAGDIPPDRAGRLAAQPAFDRLAHSLDKYQPALIDNYVFWATVGQDDAAAQRAGRNEPPARSSVIVSMKYDYEHADEILPDLERLSQDELGCGVRERARGFVPATEMPDTLRIEFVAYEAEIRYFADHFLIDAGLARASSLGQLERAMASILYRKFGAPDGPEPSEVDDDAKVYAIMRALLVSGVSAWIDDIDTILFRHRHPMLSRHQTPSPELMLEAAERHLRRITTTVDMLLSPGERQQDRRRMIFNLASASGYTRPGWAMAELIVDRLGEQRLRESADDVLDFLNAYQEAAAMGPQAPDARTASYRYWLDRLPAFTETSFPQLQELVREQAELFADQPGT